MTPVPAHGTLPFLVPKTTTVHYQRFEPKGTYDAIVVGSGIGGLTTAAMLAKHGNQRVLVLERHTVAGGFTHVFHRRGFEWDTGVHYIGGAGKSGSRERALFDHVSEGRLQWQEMPSLFERFRFGEREYEIPGGEQAYREAMGSYFPNDRKEVDRYLRATRAATKCASLYFVEKAIPALAARLLGHILRIPFLRHARERTASRLARITDNPALAALLCAQWADYGLPPGLSSFGAHAMVAQHFLNGAAYPIGGPSRIAASIVPAIERAGGTMVVGAEVASVICERGERAIGVRMADGRELRARHVISDAGARNTYVHMLEPDTKGRAAALADLGNVPPSVAHLCLYVGLRHDSTPAEFGTANLWIFRDHDHDANYAQFFADPESPLPGLFISFPAAKDPTFAQRYPGKATIQALVPARYEWFAKWQSQPWHKRGPDYDHLKQAWSARLLAELERHVPAVRGKIEFHELSTPLSTRHFANHPAGEIYGLAHTPERFRLRCLSARTAVRNLWLTGQDVVIAGVTGALMGGLITASAILRRNIVGKANKGV